MATADDAPDEPYTDTVRLSRHDLKNPLATISGRVQLMVRVVRRSPSIAEEERQRLLAGLDSIQHAVRCLVVLIDGRGAQGDGQSQTNAERGHREYS
jgi:hypothetical protein